MKYLTENLITFQSFYFYFFFFFIVKLVLLVLDEGKSRCEMEKLVEWKNFFFPIDEREKLTANREAAHKLVMKRDGKIGRRRVDGKGVVNMLFSFVQVFRLIYIFSQRNVLKLINSWRLMHSKLWQISFV